MIRINRNCNNQSNNLLSGLYLLDFFILFTTDVLRFLLQWSCIFSYLPSVAYTAVKTAFLTKEAAAYFTAWIIAFFDDFLKPHFLVFWSVIMRCKLVLNT